MQECFEGDVTFHDCDNVTMFLEGGADDAGFVQVIQGRLADPERFRRYMEQPMDTLTKTRPEIIGGTIAIDENGYFTETVAFRSEAEAREGERKEMPSEVQQQFAEEMSQVQDALPGPAPPVVRECDGEPRRPSAVAGTAGRRPRRPAPPGCVAGSRRADVTSSSSPRARADDHQQRPDPRVHHRPAVRLVGVLPCLEDGRDVASHRKKPIRTNETASGIRWQRSPTVSAPRCAT